VAKGVCIQLWRSVKDNYELSSERQYERRIKTLIGIDNGMLAIDDLTRWVLLRQWKPESTGCLSGRATGDTLSLLQQANNKSVTILTFRCDEHLLAAVFNKRGGKYQASVETIDLSKESDLKSFRASQYVASLTVTQLSTSFRMRVFVLLCHIEGGPGRILCLELNLLPEESSISQWHLPPLWQLGGVPKRSCISVIGGEKHLLIMCTSFAKLLNADNGITLATLNLNANSIPRKIFPMDEYTVLVASQEYDFRLVSVHQDTCAQNKLEMKDALELQEKNKIPLSSLAPLYDCLSLDRSTVLTRSEDGEVCIFSEKYIKFGAFGSLGGSITSSALCNYGGLATIGGRRLRLIWPEASSLSIISSIELDAAVIRSLIVCKYTNVDWLLIKTSRVGQVWMRVTNDGNIVPAPTLTEESTLHMWRLGHVILHLSPFRLLVFSLQQNVPSLLATIVGTEIFFSQEKSKFLFGTCVNEVVVLACAKAVAIFYGLDQLQIEPRRLLNLDFEISALCLSSDGKTIAIAGWDQYRVILLRTDNEDKRFHHIIVPNQNLVRSLEFFETFLLLGLADGRVFLADENGLVRQYMFGSEPIRLIKCETGSIFAGGAREGIFEMTGDQVKCRRLAPSSDRRIATVPIGSKLFAWCTANGKILVAKQDDSSQLEAGLPGAATHVLFCPKADLIVVIADDLLLFDASTARKLCIVRLGVMVTAVTRASPTPLTHLDSATLIDAISLVTVNKRGDNNLLFCDIEALPGDSHAIRPTAATPLASSCSFAAKLDHGVAISPDDGTVAVYDWELIRPEGFDDKNVWQFEVYEPRKLAQIQLPSGNKPTAISASCDLLIVAEEAHSVVVCKYSSHSIHTLAIDLTARIHRIHAVCITRVEEPLRIALAYVDEDRKLNLMELQANEDIVSLLSSAKSSQRSDGEHLPNTALTASTMRLHREFSAENETISQKQVVGLFHIPSCSSTACVNRFDLEGSSFPPPTMLDDEDELTIIKMKKIVDGGVLEPPHLLVVHSCGSISRFKL